MKSRATVFTVDLPVQTCETILAEDSLKSSISASVPLNPASPGSPASSNLNETLAVEEEELEKGYDSSKPSVLILMIMQISVRMYADYSIPIILLLKQQTVRRVSAKQ